MSAALLPFCFGSRQAPYGNFYMEVRMKRTLLASLFALLFAGCLSLEAQTTTGTIRGVVTDSSGAAVPNAAVVATNVATGVRTCLRSLEQQSEESQVDHLQTGVQLSFAVLP